MNSYAPSPHLRALLQKALESPGLLAPNEFNLARYSLDAKTRNQLLDPDILALEDYLIDHSGLPERDCDPALLHNFGDAVYEICTHPTTPLMVGYQSMGWLLAWLNSHHLPSFFGEDPDSPLQTLQMAAALGYGEWAAAYNQVEEGLDKLFTLANSPLWRVREAAALGLQRLMQHAWERSIRRLRYHLLIANLPEWCAVLDAWRNSPTPLFIPPQARLLDILDLLQDGLRFVATLEDHHRADPMLPHFFQIFNSTLAHVVRAEPEIGFAQLGVWAHWENPDVRAILRANLVYLDDWTEAVAQIERQLDRP
jgi:hypothetical protein